MLTGRQILRIGFFGRAKFFRREQGLAIGFLAVLVVLVGGMVIHRCKIGRPTRRR